MLCPVCESEATNVTAADYDGLSVKCSVCGRLDVAGSAIPRLEKLNPAGKRLALEKAGRFKGAARHPTITTLCL